MNKARLVLPVAVLYTGVAALATVFCLFAVATSIYYQPTVERTGSGGIGAVSVGLGNPIVLGTLLFVIAGFIVNISIKPEIARRGRLAIAARRAHLALMFVTLIWPAPFGFLLIHLSERDVRSGTAVAAAAASLFSAIHATFGFFAIRLLRRGS